MVRSLCDVIPIAMVLTPGLDISIHQKKRRISCCMDSSLCKFRREGEIPLPILGLSDYFNIRVYHVWTWMFRIVTINRSDYCSRSN